MTSLIKADNIAKADGTSEVATEYVTQGSAKAFVQFDGTAGTISAGESLNTASLTDLGTGHYRQNLTSAMATTTYVPTGNASDNSGVSPWGMQSPATFSLDMRTTNLAGAAGDRPNISFLIHGDLA